MTRNLSLLFLFLVATAANAQDLSSFEKILFPVLSSQTLSGANNTTFQTKLQAVAKESIAYYPAVANGEPAFGVQPAGIDFVRFYEARPRSAGRLLYFDRAKTDALRLFFELDVTGPDRTIHRTTLPVVRERAFEHGDSTILGLQTNPRASKPVEYRERNHVRIYDVDTTGNLAMTVLVMIPGLEAYGPFARYDINVAARDANDPSYPFYADVALPDLCVTAPSGDSCHDYPLIVTLKPADANARYWAFASATDNATGETAVFYAQ